jgi:hypothetical protein
MMSFLCQMKSKLELPLPHMPSSLQTNAKILRTIRIWLSLFILGLVLSGLTAFPLEHETSWLASLLHAHPILPGPIIVWIAKVAPFAIPASAIPSSPTAPTGSPSPILSSPSPSSVRCETLFAISGCFSSALSLVSPLSSSRSSQGLSGAFHFYGDLSIAVLEYLEPSLCSFASAW